MLRIVCMCIAFSIAIAVLSGCTEKQQAKELGVGMIVRLPCGQKLLMATWKQNHLWYLTRPRRAGEVPETHTFIEEPSWGNLDAKVMFVECK